MLKQLEQIFAQMNDSDLDAAFDALRVRREQINRQKIRMFRIGDKVKFPGKHDRPIVGTVQKINTKTIVVVNCVFEGTNQKAPSYRVSPSMLEPVGLVIP